MSAHTPGPWTATGNRITDWTGASIAYVNKWSDKVDRADWDNARVMAAAPELLAALKHLTRAVKIKGPMGTTAYLHADADMRAALEAIAKATGGAE